ncbi:VOC family protein [Aquamicrobium segne]|uniref:VOC family protein n=1 Tax=Aquamicrobium segne TaxID=469547 RepID=A0ABW0GWM8_9HYPH
MSQHATTSPSGIHHVTLITRNVQKNVDFYAGFLGLRLVKRTGGYEDAEQLHLFYGDALGSPGTLVTFLVWEEGASGRVGHGQVFEFALAVPRQSLGEWMTRCLQHGIAMQGPSHEFGETVLRLKDPDGFIVKLVGVDMPSAHPWGDASRGPTRLRAVTILSEAPEETAAFITRFGYRIGPVESNTTRMISDTDVIDIRDGTGFVEGIPGTGTADHVAFRAADITAIKALEAQLATLNSSPTNSHDRHYFTSLYVREPAGTLLEVATDGPGFTIDETADLLGTELMVPPEAATRAEDIKLMLPQFSMPGEPRLPHRDLPFVHRFYTPKDPDETVIVLLHGSGGTEADLMPLAHRIAPRATLLGVRGRAHEEGSARWFRRLGPTVFDQADIHSEAEAFAAFIEGAVAAYRLDPARMIFLGNSNGANFLASIMALQPGHITKAILLRPIMVLDHAPETRLDNSRVLMITGKRDPFANFGQKLVQWLDTSGALFEQRCIDASHELSSQDEIIAQEWLLDQQTESLT